MLTTMQRQTRDVLVNPAEDAVVLLVLTVDKLGVECLNWTPSTVQMDLRDYIGQELPEEVVNKIMAASVVLTSDKIFSQVDDFIRVIVGLDGGVAENLEPIDTEVIAWGSAQIQLLRAGDMPEGLFSPEVCRYVGTILAWQGIHVPPKSLTWADYPQHDQPFSGASAENPEALASFHSACAREAGEIDLLVAKRTKELFERIVRLPLEHGGGGEEIKKRLTKLMTGERSG